MIRVHKMNMNIVCMIISVILYSCMAIGNYRQGDYPHVVMWLSYATGNLGLLWYEYGKIIAGK